jgi:hypothetical protein
VRNLTRSELEAKLPKLRSQPYKHDASDATGRYNCVSFAIEKTRKWLEAGLHGGRYDWPPDIPDTIDGWTEMFVREGYELTTNRDVESGFQKVAIYIDLDDMRPGHVAKLDGTKWKSKLGRYQDIEHSSLDVLEGDEYWEYGVVDRVLRRPIKINEKAPVKRTKKAAE